MIIIPAKPIHLIIKSLYQNLSQKEQLIANYIVTHPEKVAHGTISDISNELDIADSTFFQFTKKLGFNGFKDFKIALLIEDKKISNISIHESIEKDDSEITVAKKVFDSNIQALRDTRELFTESDLKNATDIMFHSNTVAFFGIGGSDIIAMDAFHKFMRSPIHCIHNTDYHIQLMQAALLKKGDCAFIISHTGLSKESIKIAQTAKENGASIIVLTSRSNSELAKLGDIVFISIAEETEYRSEALSSRITQLSIIDALYVILMFIDEKKSTATLNKVRKTIASVKR